MELVNMVLERKICSSGIITIRKYGYDKAQNKVRNMQTVHPVTVYKNRQDTHA
jgi:hypothetical protein